MSRDGKNDYIPRDYDDLYRYYIVGDGSGGSLCHTLIRKWLPYATPDERETLSQDVVMRCIAKDIMKVFDPTKANFGGVIFFVTRTICANHLNRKGRNPVTGLCAGSLTETDPEDGVFEPGVYSLDRIFGSGDPNYEEQLEARTVVEALFDWTKKLYDQPRHKRDQSLYPLLMLLVQERDTKECGDELGVTASTISNWLKVLRDQVTVIKQELAIA